MLLSRCSANVALKIRGDATSSEVASTSRWIAPSRMSEKAPKVCEQERSQVLDRTNQVLVPSPTP